MKPIQFIYTTRHGTYFNLTPTNLIELNLQNALVSIGDFAHMEKILEKLQDQNISFKKYLGLNEKTHQTYLTAVDSYKERCIEGSHLQMTVKLKQNIGYKLFTIDQHNKLAELIKPDLLVTLTETPPSGELVGLKSNKRAVEKSLFFLEKSLKYFKDKTYKPQIFAAMQGGLNNELRALAVYYTLQTIFKDKVPIYENFGGFVFYGFQSNEDWADKDGAIQSSLNEIPDDMKEDISLVLAGKGDILSIIWGLTWGFDRFEIEEPFNLASKFQALTLSHILKDVDVKELNEFQNDQINFFEYGDSGLTYLTFPMEDSAHEPICEICQCFTCRNHTKLYITHLVQCHEMNAVVLLTIHNTYQYQQFIKRVQFVREQKVLNSWLRWVLYAMRPQRLL